MQASKGHGNSLGVDFEKASSLVLSSWGAWLGAGKKEVKKKESAEQISAEENV